MARAQVASLSRLSLDGVAGVLAGALELEQVASVRRYLLEAGVTGHVLQELLQALLPRTDLEQEFRMSALLALLRDDVASLSVGAFSEALHATLLSALEERGSGLHTLDMKGSWLRGDNLSALCAALPRLRGLRVLGVPRMATDDLLIAVGEHCTKLRALDVSGESTITRKGLEGLCLPGGLTQTLQILDIGNLAEMNVSVDDIAFLIRSLPRLISLGTYSHVGKALVLLEERADTSSTMLEYLHDLGTTPRVVAAMERLCPRLTSVYLDRPAPGALPLLRRLPRLRELKLHQFEVGELMTLLQEAGGQLEELELLGGSAGSGLAVLDLSRVSALCRRLARLECHLVHCTHSAGTAWPALRSLGVFRTSMAGRALLAVALGAPHLVRLCIGSTPELSDAELSELSAALPGLRELWLADAPDLTQAAVLCLLTGSPELRSLGELSGWGLGPLEVDELRIFCLESNLDVALWCHPALETWP